MMCKEDTSPKSEYLVTSLTARYPACLQVTQASGRSQLELQTGIPLIWTLPSCEPDPPTRERDPGDKYCWSKPDVLFQFYLLHVLLVYLVSKIDDNCLKKIFQVSLFDNNSFPLSCHQIEYLLNFPPLQEVFRTIKK